VVAVNSDLEFDRELRPGERLYYTTRLDSIGEQKTTALGTGFFVTLMMSYFSERRSPADGDEKVGEQLFRVFKFKPAQPVKPAAAGGACHGRPSARCPGISDDTRFFWDGAREGKLLIQRCKACSTLRHPPGPSMHGLPFLRVGHAAGQRAAAPCTPSSSCTTPRCRRSTTPTRSALVELDEGTRLVAQLVGVPGDEIRIGQAVQVEFATFNDGELVLPQFRPVGA
jgi:uncharacterized OB-fold protein